MYTLDGILEKLRLHKPKLQRKYPISQMGVFGSYARGDATESSDIDIASELNGRYSKKPIDQFHYSLVYAYRSMKLVYERPFSVCGGIFYSGDCLFGDSWIS